jgi:DNA-binding GntR family transcriptional regulator
MRQGIAANDRPGADRAEAHRDVYETIKQDIIQCILGPGQPLNESELAERLSVSKTRVREALTRLKQDRLVESIPRQGYLIAPITLRGIRDTFEVRLILERAATMLAARNISSAQVRSLERYLGIHFDAGDLTTTSRYIQANKEFHLEIAAVCRNERLTWHLEHVLDDAQRLVYMDLKTNDAPWAWQRDHERILEALRCHDEAAAAKAVEDGLAEARERLLAP